MATHKSIVCDEKGAMSLLAAVMIAALVIIAGAVGWACMRVIDSHRAQLAADMAAVSAAYEHYVGGDGCVKAQEIALENGASLASCEIVLMDARVRVRVGQMGAVAVAGPS